MIEEDVNRFNSRVEYSKTDDEFRQLVKYDFEDAINYFKNQ